MDNTEEYTCLSLCTGYGGIELGLKRAISNLRTIAYVEIEAFACANLVSKMEAGLLDAAPIWTDIKTFNAEPFRDKVHIITAGYPCQPFSCAGKRQGESDPRHLWPHIARIIQAVRPVWFFGENVAGHLTLGFPEVYRSLRNLDYNIEAGLFSAAECGAPHQRCRLFMLAYDANSGCKSVQGKQKRKSSSKRSCNVADPKYTKQRDRIIKETQTQIGRNRFTIGNEDVADPTSKRIQRSEPEGTAQAGRQINQQSITRWPARPGQQQYEWECPRTLGNTRIEKRTGLSDNERQKIPATRSTGKMGDSDRPRKAGIGGQSIKEPVERPQNAEQILKSRLGRAINGTSSRVDRLRLLGNGVVPQQAEKAFRYLYEMMMMDACPS